MVCMRQSASTPLYRWATIAVQRLTLWATGSSKMACEVFIHTGATLRRSSMLSMVGALPARGKALAGWLPAVTDGRQQADMMIYPMSAVTTQQQSCMPSFWNASTGIPALYSHAIHATRHPADGRNSAVPVLSGVLVPPMGAIDSACFSVSLPVNFSVMAR